MMVTNDKGSRKKLRHVIGVLKDKTSLIKTCLFLSKRKSVVRLSIIRATTHRRSSSPSEVYVNGLLTLGGTCATSSVFIESIMDRLHKTHDAYVALIKCLFILHRISIHGTFILKDQLSIYPTSGGRNFINLSDFCDGDESDENSFEISKWVRWYAGVLEQHLIMCRGLEMIYDQTNKEDYMSCLPNLVFVKELDGLVCFVEQVSVSPDSYYLQKYDVVHDVVNSTEENYAMVQREILIRVKEIDSRTDGFSDSELTQLVNVLERVENCRERLVRLFVNRWRNQDLWDLIGASKDKVSTVNVNRMNGRMVVVSRRKHNLLQFAERARVNRNNPN